jgi:hypothetical protein
MSIHEVKFDGKVIARVNVSAAAAKKTLAIVGEPVGDAKSREFVAIAKLFEANRPSKTDLSCIAPTDDSYDVGVLIAGILYQADIKTIYPSYESRQGFGTLLDSLIDVMDKSLDKEHSQGNICLFDLSYIEEGLRQSMSSIIHNTSQTSMTLEYDYYEQQNHFILPTKYEYHFGNWYH